MPAKGASGVSFEGAFSPLEEGAFSLLEEGAFSLLDSEEGASCPFSAFTCGIESSAKLESDSAFTPGSRLTAGLSASAQHTTSFPTSLRTSSLRSSNP